jgi:hypothetical protein
MSMKPRAAWHDALAAQMELWTWERSSYGQKWLGAHWRHTVPGLNAQTSEMLEQMYAAEARKIRDADPVYVSREMCELIAVAKESCRLEPMLRADLLTDQAFCYFAEPFLIPDRFEAPIRLAAFSWAPMLAVRPEEAEAAGNVAELMDRWRSGADADERGHDDQGVALTLYAVAQRDAPWNEQVQGPMPTLLPTHVTPWWFGMTFEGNEWDETGTPTGAEWWWRIVQTTLRLMQQRISVRHKEQPDRPLRRQGRRLKFSERQVVVVKLRRERGEQHEPSGESANYSHRFIVGGHWRDQWYPSLNVHRQVWISPYVKGPEDKPLIVKRRAYDWRR